ncbi:MAG: N-formylglutamate amidohydrolase [Candidatus Hermodarchaeota archaeon]
MEENVISHRVSCLIGTSQLVDTKQAYKEASLALKSSAFQPFKDMKPKIRFILVYFSRNHNATLLHNLLVEDFPQTLFLGGVPDVQKTLEGNSSRLHLTSRNNTTIQNVPVPLLESCYLQLIGLITPNVDFFVGTGQPATTPQALAVSLRQIISAATPTILEQIPAYENGFFVLTPSLLRGKLLSSVKKEFKLLNRRIPFVGGPIEEKSPVISNEGVTENGLGLALCVHSPLNSSSIGNIFHEYPCIEANLHIGQRIRQFNHKWLFLSSFNSQETNCSTIQAINRLIDVEKLSPHIFVLKNSYGNIKLTLEPRFNGTTFTSKELDLVGRVSEGYLHYFEVTLDFTIQKLFHLSEPRFSFQRGENHKVLVSNPHGVGLRHDKNSNILAGTLAAQTNSSILLANTSRTFRDWNSVFDPSKNLYVQQIMLARPEIVLDIHTMKNYLHSEIDLGTCGGYSCSKDILEKLETVLQQSFKVTPGVIWSGGAITQLCGDEGINAIQLEVSRTVIDDPNRRQILLEHLKEFVKIFALS